MIKNQYLFEIHYTKSMQILGNLLLQIGGQGKMSQMKQILC